MAGYIKLHRGWRNNDVLRAPAQFSEPEAWLWLLENAAFKDMTRTGGSGQSVLVPEGHIHCSERSLASAWGWDRKRVRRFVSRLISGEMLSRDCPESDPSKGTKKGTSSGTTYRIVNWAKYQKQGQAKGPAMGPEQGPAEDQLGTTQEEGKEGKEEKNYAFAGRVVRLNFADYRRWQNAYPDLDLRAQLTARDDWLTGQPEKDRSRWFQSTSSWLAKRQQEAAALRPPQAPVIGI